MDMPFHIVINIMQRQATSLNQILKIDANESGNYDKHRARGWHHP